MKRKHGATKKAVKPSKSDQQKHEFRRQVVGLSVSELNYRLDVNANAAADVQLDIAEAQAKLTQGRQNLAQLALEHGVLSELIEERR